MRVIKLRYKLFLVCLSLPVTRAQGNREGGAIAQLAIGIDAATHGFHLGFCEEEAHAFAVFALVECFVKTKQLFSVAGHVNTLTIVLHGEYNVLVDLKRLKVHAQRPIM